MLAAEGTREHESKALNAGPEVAVHTLTATVPSGSEAGSADDEPEGGGERDGGPEHDGGMAVDGADRARAERGGGNGKAGEDLGGGGGVEDAHLRRERDELIRVRKGRRHGESDRPGGHGTERAI